MNLKQIATKIADIYSTAPLGETLLAYNLASSVISYKLLDKPLHSYIALSFGIAGAAASIPLIIRQFNLRKKLENSVKEFGYDKRVFYNTLDLWCDKQTAKVAARNTGCLDKYLSLIENGAEK